MEEYLREDSYIRLIQCFLNPELMLKNPEPPNVLRDDQPIIELTPGGGYRPRPRDGKREDPLHLLFQPEGPQQQGKCECKVPSSCCLSLLRVSSKCTLERKEP